MTGQPFPLPESDYWKAIESGRLTFQRCSHCAHAWLPDRQACPNCWQANSTREQASGKATVVSWVVYHVAFHPAFEGRLPYNVAIVQLAEGPRMVTNLTNLAGWSGSIADAPVELDMQEEFGRRIPRFRLVG